MRLHARVHANPPRIVKAPGAAGVSVQSLADIGRARYARSACRLAPHQPVDGSEGQRQATERAPGHAGRDAVAPAMTRTVMVVEITEQAIAILSLLASCGVLAYPGRT